MRIAAVFMAAMIAVGCGSQPTRAAELEQGGAELSAPASERAGEQTGEAATEPEGEAPPSVPEVSSEALSQPSSAPSSAAEAPEAAQSVAITASGTSTAQGGLLTLHAENLPEGVLPAVTTTLSYTPLFFSTGAHTADALLPVRSGTETGSYTLTVTAGEVSADFSIEVTDAGFKVQYFEMDESVASDTLYNSDAADEFEALYQRMKSADGNIYWHDAFILPLELDEVRVSSNFGDTRYVNNKLSGRHGGVDFPAPQGTPVHASNSGKVAFAGFMQQTGNTVCIEHGLGLKSWYFHMDSLSCATGDMVETGQEIGNVGTTGASTGYHLHLAFSVGGVYVSPWMLIDGGVALPADSE